MVECTLHGSDHEPWQCPGSDSEAGRMNTYQLAMALHDSEVERNRYRQTLEVVLALAEEPDEWDNIARTVRAALEEE